MKEYKTTKTTMSLINYHFVFCPKYRRKIFLIEGVEERFKELTKTICTEHEIEILALECHIDYVHLVVSVYPKTTIQNIMTWIKEETSRILRKEFKELSRMSSLWTRSYFVSTEPYVSEEAIQCFIQQQKKRG